MRCSAPPQRQSLRPKILKPKLAMNAAGLAYAVTIRDAVSAKRHTIRLKVPKGMMSNEDPCDG